MQKINLNKFNRIELTARLFILQGKIFSIKYTTETFNLFTLGIIRDNFLYPEEMEREIHLNFMLFMMGNENNLFSKAIKIL